jgi:hypothetical protein
VDDPYPLLAQSKLPPDQQTAFALVKGIEAIGRTYRVIKLGAAKPPNSRLLSAYRKIADLSSALAQIFEEDAADTEQLQTEFAIRFNIGTREFASSVRQVATLAEQTTTMLEVELDRMRTVLSRHREAPATWLFLALHDLYAELSGRKPGIAGPLHRFTERCAALIDREIEVPPLEPFRARIRAALRRRGADKISVFPMEKISPP